MVVRGLLDATLTDIATGQARSAAPKVGDTLDGLVVNALVADSGTVLYQIRDRNADPGALKT